MNQVCLAIYSPPTSTTVFFHVGHSYQTYLLITCHIALVVNLNVHDLSRSFGVVSLTWQTESDRQFQP